MNTIPDLKQYISRFTFNDCARGNQGFSRVLIQLFGFAGNGKSSFINTCLYAMEDEEFRTHSASTDGYGGHTQMRISYPVKGTSMTLVDNKGCIKLEGNESGEIYAQLGNLLPLDEKVQYDNGYSKLMERIVRAEKIVKASDFIYPVYVHSVKRGIAPEHYDDLKELLTTARDLTGIFPFIVLTHKTTGDLVGTMSKFKQMGGERFFALENFTPRDHMKTRGRFEDVLRFFCEVIEDIQFRVDRLRNPEKEREQRKEFVFNYMHEMEIKKREQMTELERAKDQVRQEGEITKKLLELQVNKEHQEALAKEMEELKVQLQKKKKKKKGDKCDTQ